jgi:hypothetical protein
METLTATITTIGVIALAAISYRLLLNLERHEKTTNHEDKLILTTNQSELTNGDAIRLINQNGVLSDAVTRPNATNEDHPDYHPNSLDNYGSPRFDEQVTVEAYRNHLNKVGPVKEGIGTILAHDEGDDWWPITYRPGHDALGFEKLWLYQANGPGGKFCWHISRQGWHRHARPITVTSWGTIGTIEEIREIVAQVTA